MFAFSLAVPFALAQENVFVPNRPAKPLRFCTLAKKWVEYAEADSNLVEISHLESIHLDMRYATFDNITGHDLYCGMQRAFIHKDALPKLKLAIQYLKKDLPGFKFVIFDASRPMYAQAALKASVAGTPFTNYVSSGKTGGLHNYGLALDIGLLDSEGRLLDMGADFDSFEDCAGSQGESRALKSGRLTSEQIENREKLRRVMKRAGWVPLGSEWWHFNVYSRSYTKEHYTLFPI